MIAYVTGATASSMRLLFVTFWDKRLPSLSRTSIHSEKQVRHRLADKRGRALIARRIDPHTGQAMALPSAREWKRWALGGAPPLSAYPIISLIPSAAQRTRVQYSLGVEKDDRQATGGGLIAWPKRPGKAGH